MATRNKLGRFIKGNKPWCTGKKRPEITGENHPLYGKHHTKKTKRKMREAHKGRIAWNKGKKLSKEHRKRLSESHKGITHSVSKEAREKIRKALMGNKNGWLGGISFEPYGVEFNNKLKEKIRERDNYCCQECHQTQKELGYKLPVHHIDYNKKNNQEDNLISLCRNCHAQTGFNRGDWENYFRGRAL